MGTLFTDILLTVCIPVIQTVAHGASNPKVMGLIPREQRKKVFLDLLHILNAIYVWQMHKYHVRNIVKSSTWHQNEVGFRGTMQV